MLPYDNDILSKPSITRSLTLIEHKEDVNECTHDHIIVKPTSVVLNMLQEIQLYINSHNIHDNSNINTCIYIHAYMHNTITYL